MRYGDLISRTEVLETAYAWIQKTHGCGPTSCGLLRRLEKIPTARRVAKRTMLPLVCERCHKSIPLSWDTYLEIGATQSTYCEDCLREGLRLLRAKDKEENNEQRD